jgi:hypothetical protein
MQPASIRRSERLQSKISVPSTSNKKFNSQDSCSSDDAVRNTLKKKNEVANDSLRSLTPAHPYGTRAHDTLLGLSTALT